MRRLLWLALGTGAAILAVRMLAQRPGPAADAPAGSPGERLAEFWAVVRAAAAEREAQLREEVGLDGRHDLVDAPENASGSVGGIGENR